MVPLTVTYGSLDSTAHSAARSPRPDVVTWGKRTKFMDHDDPVELELDFLMPKSCGIATVCPVEKCNNNEFYSHI